MPHRHVRVLHLISSSHPTDYFRLIARHTDYERFGLQVGSVTGRGGLQTGLQEMGISTFALGADRRLQYPLTALRLAWWLRQNRIDVVHAHLFDASIVGLLAATAVGAPLRVFTGHHSHEVPLYNRRTLFEMDRLAARQLADVVVAPSREMAATFVTTYGCNPDDVIVIEHGLDLTRFDPAQANGQKFRAELGLDSKLVFGAVSKHHWVKNLDALVRGFAPLAAAQRDAHLVILGIGDSSSLGRLVGELDLSQRVSILAPREDIPDVLAAIDVFVHPALAESFGFAVVEAMAMAKPVVSRRVGIVGDVLIDGVSGIEVRGTDPRSLQDAMTRAIAVRHRWPALGAHARKQVLGFTAERWVRAHERLYLSRLGLS
jgi:L-malate glycosyltransferase